MRRHSSIPPQRPPQHTNDSAVAAATSTIVDPVDVAAPTTASSRQHHPRIRVVRAAMHKSRTRTITPEPRTENDGQSEDTDAAAAVTVTCSALGSASAVASPRPPWRRILYAAQPYPDTHTASSFLSSLVTNANVHPVSLRQLCLSACVVTQRLCLLALFLLVFYALLHALVAVEWILMLDAASLMIGLMVFGLHRAPRLLLLTAVLFFLAPLLSTLTQAYSSDTIWALSMMLCALHLLAFDYGWINEAESGKKDFQGSLSLNAGIFAAILLGSRLESAADSTAAAATPAQLAAISSFPLSSLLSPSVRSLLSSSHVLCFAFVLWSFLVFGGMSVVSARIRARSVRAHVAATAALAILTTGALCALVYLPSARPLPALVPPLFVCALLFVSVLAPRWFLFAQQYKNEMQGPWDYDDEAEMESDNL